MLVYQPDNSISDKVARRLRPFKNRREVRFALSKPIVSLTFDDFPRSAITHGAKPMHEHGWTGTFYTSAGMAGLTNHHGEQFHREDLMWLEARGHEIAGHTLDHTDCTKLERDALLLQIDRNKAALKAMGVRGPINGFAYPFGAANPVLKQELSRKFKAIRGIQDGVHIGRADLNELKACGVYSSTIAKIIKRIRALRSRPGWLILFTHDIRENPSDWGCTPEEFQTVLNEIAQLDCDVLPVAGALQALEERALS